MASPLVIVVDFVAAGYLLDFYTYLVLAQSKMNGLVGLGEVLFLKNNQNYIEQLFKLRASLQPWQFSSLVFASGLFKGVDQVQLPHEPEAQLPSKNAVFPMPQQFADLTPAEVEDLVPVVAPVPVPIFGPFGTLTISHEADIDVLTGSHSVHLYISAR